MKTYTVVDNIIFPIFEGGDPHLQDFCEVTMIPHDREMAADRQIPNPPTESAVVTSLHDNIIIHSVEPPVDCA